ncbi:glycosaminoglycan xylosylkinase homolog [Anopheles nili]|uniref:glycosaminoglycan xylosylkinase homolog n=1 Tax=Anopheles nili TaxID=185578 RepID=UPI00237B556D|nr:glycosaminoglycan xylosylkinase homolog [Anopheles nili]
MTKSSFYNILCLLCLSLVVYYSLNVYLIHNLQSTAPKDDIGAADRSASSNQAGRAKPFQNSSDVNKALSVQNAIVRKSETLKPVFRNRNPKYVPIKHDLVSCFLPKAYNISSVFRTANSWSRANEVFPLKDKTVGGIINAIRTEPIRSIKNSRRGTQLKLVLELVGSQYVLFKPSWYQREDVINGTVYSGKDRHNSEIVSFHLAAILNLRYTPIATGRKISLRDNYLLADEELRKTMPVINGQQCAYGSCHYCKPDEVVCDDLKTGMLEGAVLYTIPGKIVKYRSPWQRTYNVDLKAEWEKNDNYCSLVRKKLQFEVLLDLIDAAIFDFLIQNGDRHHYETREERLLLLDNGKGFGNPFVDHLDILAPVYQCCFIRRTTWERLLLFSGGALTETLEELNKLDLLNPLLTKDHYIALERRLLYVYSTVELCKEKYGNKVFK